MSYEGSNLVILDSPTKAESCLERDLLPGGTVIVKQGDEISVQVKGYRECYRLDASESFSSVYLKEISRLILEIAD
jgi:hypothetical protein